MRNNPLVSIAIPVYKSEFLSETIESALNQSYKNIELLIVNDCSPQNIDSIVQRYMDDPRLHYYKNEKNIGSKDPAANWNKCLSYAKGEFFSLLCDDDVYAPTFIEKMLCLANKYAETNVFRARVKLVDNKGALKNLFPSAPEWESAVDYMWAIVSSYRLQTISEFMYRTDYIKQQGGYISLPKAWCSDHASIIKLAKNGGIATCNELLVQFRMSGLNISTSNSKYIREKVNAQVRYTKLIGQLLVDETEEMRNLILNIRGNKIRDIMTQYLVNANLKDFIYLYGKRNTEEYKIPSRCFTRALNNKLAKFIKKCSAVRKNG